MRGGSSDMNPTCVQSGIPHSFGYHPNTIMEPHSPSPAWPQQQIIPKQEPMEEERHDSGLASGNEFQSSPSSENSLNYSPLNQNLSNYLQVGYHQSDSQREPDDALRRLEMTVEKNNFSNRSSPKPSEHSVEEDNRSDPDTEEGLEIDFTSPKLNSHGKMKKFKCKQCDFVAVTKMEFWRHSREHIKEDKRLSCPRCPFVTEYKHHLEYHLRNHYGSKPFRCNKCSYSCVNKSMLNSHMKSHSNVYQYRCADCSYVTKYCHSLKLHLRKYSHKPAMVLHPDGTPNPFPIIDVYGTRRGPKQKSHAAPRPPKPEEPDATSQQIADCLLNNSSQTPLPFPYHLLAGIPNPALLLPGVFENILKLQEHLKEAADKLQTEGTQSSPTPTIEQQVPEALDLSKPETTVKNRRKGPAFKLEKAPPVSDEEEEETREATPKGDSPLRISDVNMEEVLKNMSNNFDQYCNISFGDVFMYAMHMGFHGYKDPYTCNMCGERCPDKLSFFFHIARNAHA